MASQSCLAASCLMLAAVPITGMVAPASAEAISPPEALSIRARCTGGLEPRDRDVTISADGQVVVNEVGRVTTRTVDPNVLRRISARLDAAGFDRITVPARIAPPLPDARSCVLSRTLASGTHGVAISRDTPGELRGVLAVLLSLAAKPAPRGQDR